jgi:hypothetical protein
LPGRGKGVASGSTTPAIAVRAMPSRARPSPDDRSGGPRDRPIPWGSSSAAAAAGTADTACASPGRSSRPPAAPRQLRPWRTRSLTPDQRAVVRRLPSASRDSACASSGRCIHPAGRGETAERVANQQRGCRRPYDCSAGEAKAARLGARNERDRAADLAEAGPRVLGPLPRYGSGGHDCGAAASREQPPATERVRLSSVLSVVLIIGRCRGCGHHVPRATLGWRSYRLRPSHASNSSSTARWMINRAPNWATQAATP